MILGQSLEEQQVKSFFFLISELKKNTKQIKISFTNTGFTGFYQNYVLN